jgi:hypothetical protein
VPVWSFSPWARVPGRRGKNGTPPSLPAYHDPGLRIGLIRFADDWTPTVTWLRRSEVQLPWLNLFTSLAHGLRPAFEQLADYEERTGRHCG